MITADVFYKAVGSPPERDDLQRCNCKEEGQLGHQFCGWCTTHNKPRFVCGCMHPNPPEKKS
ncbi:MAG: hypothetical protein WC869_00790 [Phycisphaerae bacterium]|jgi:hypothetical protein